MAVKKVNYRNIEFRLSYDRLHAQRPSTILFLHGWGSNKELMRQAFGRLLTGYHHLYLDLPGFGKSDNPTVLGTDDYAEIVRTFLSELDIVPDIIVGHSFGGKVATLLKPPRLILLSSAGIVFPKPLAVRAKIALFKLLKPIGGTKLRRFFVSDDAKEMPSNMYETFKRVVNEDFTPHFSEYRGRALLCWGKEDRATPPEAGRRIASLIPQARLEMFEGDHYFFLQDPKSVTKVMEDFVASL